MDLLIEVLVEALLELFSQFLWMLGDCLTHTSERHPSVVGRTLLYLFLGLLCGALSRWLWPVPHFGGSSRAVLSLGLIPVAVGFAGALMSRILEERWDVTLATSKFFYAWLFAICFSAVRFY